MKTSGKPSILGSAVQIFSQKCEKYHFRLTLCSYMREKIVVDTYRELKYSIKTSENQRQGCDNVFRLHNPAPTVSFSFSFSLFSFSFSRAESENENRENENGVPHSSMLWAKRMPHEGISQMWCYRNWFFELSECATKRFLKFNATELDIRKLKHEKTKMKILKMKTELTFSFSFSFSLRENENSNETVRAGFWRNMKMHVRMLATAL